MNVTLVNVLLIDQTYARCNLDPIGIQMSPVVQRDRVRAQA